MRWPWRQNPDGIDRSAFEALVKRVDGLELADAERHITVLSAIEKVLHGVEARLRMRERARASEGGDHDTGDEAIVQPGASSREVRSIATLKRRLRGF